MTDTLEDTTLDQASANRAMMMAALLRCGVATVTVHFDGGGDSGQVEDIEVNWLLNGTDKTLKDVPLEGKLKQAMGQSWNGTAWETRWTEKEGATVHDIVEEVVYAALSATDIDWVNNDGGYGEVSIVPAEDTIKIDMNARFTSSEYSEHEY